MNVYLEVAQRLRVEIDEAEAHLANLRRALDGLRPLITMDVEVGEFNKGQRLISTGDSAPLVEEVPAEEQVQALNVRSVVQPRRPSKKPKSVAQSPFEAAAAVQELAKPKPRAVRKLRANATLPSTGAKFWTALMGKRAYTIAEIVDRAIKKLGEPEESRAVLSNRLSAWLFPAIHAGKAEQSDMKGKLKRYRISSSD